MATKMLGPAPSRGTIPFERIIAFIRTMTEAVRMTGTTTATDQDRQPIDKQALLAKYSAERDKRLRVDGNAQYLRLQGQLAHYLDDPYMPRTERAPLSSAISEARSPRQGTAADMPRTSVEIAHLSRNTARSGQPQATAGANPP